MVEKREFTCRQAARLAGFDNHMMVDYLCRQGILIPSILSSPGRGRPRLFSFWDVVLLRAVNQILSAGVPVARLKKAMSDFQNELNDLTPEEAIIRRFMVTDGTEVFMVEEPDTIVQLTSNGQLAFAFVLDAEDARREVHQQAKTESAVAS